MRRLSLEMMALFGSRVGVAGFGLVTSIILARGLGPHDRGLLALALLLPSTLLTLTKLGIAQANVYCTRREGAPLAQVASNSLALALGLGLLGGAVVWLLREPLQRTVLRDLPTWALLVAMWRLPLLLIDSYFWGVLQAMGRFSVYNRRTLGGAAGVLVGVGTLWMVGRLSLSTALTVYALCTTLMVGSLVVTVRRLLPFSLGIDRSLLARQLSFGSRSYTQILTMHLLYRSDVYLVAYLLDPARTAFYSLALHFAEVLLEIPQAVGWVIYPKLASMDKADVHRTTAQTCRRTLLLTALAGLALVGIGPFLIPLWYGRAFAPAAAPLPFVAVGAVAMAIFTILSRDFTSRNRQSVNIFAGAVALGVNLGLNVFLIPLWGIVGAAVATAIAYCLAAGLLIGFFRLESGLSVREALVPRWSDVTAIWTAARQPIERKLARLPVARRFVTQPSSVTAEGTSTHAK
ncbi:MAG: polysaccharide biosynthesis C-terminal domain-containing protein [Candidatus Binatia bacterium]|nr:polysaccharide biosynthesis C-terminal domain-containing protein [Candidatus Binatia bacterium]